MTIKALLKAGANPRVSLRLWGEWDRTALGVLLDSSTAPPYEADPEVLDLLLAHGAKWEDLGRNQNRRIREILSLPGLGEVAVRHGLRGDALIPAFAFSSRGEGKETSSTLLHAAAEGGVVKVVEALVKAGGQINGADGAGYTPLARAVAAGREEVTEFLIKRGAKIDVVTTDGLSLVDLAAQANNRRRIKLWDKSDRYRELLDSFSPPSNSKWTGKWMMGDPKYPSVVTLEKDGSGYSGFGWLMWTETDEGIRLRMTRTNRLGLPAGTVELDLESDQLGGLRRKQQGAEGQWHLWRPQHPPQPDSEKALANAMERQKLQAKIDEQFAALASGRSDGFWLDSSTPPSGLPEQVWTETRWARFSVHGGELGTLPRAMSGMSRLKHLEISNQKRLRIEPGALALPALEMLDLRSTGLEELPVDWSLLPQLQQVTIFDSRLSALPGGWRNARNLIWFGVGDSRLRTLPDDLGEAPVLKRLGASGQQLRELPASLANSVVEELYLDSNRFERMPTCVRSMRTLRSLSFGQNRLVSVGAEELPSGLHSLGLAGNRLRRVPDLSTLQQLEKLDLSSNAIEELPDDPGWLPSSVIELNLRGNPIKTIPDWLRTRAFRRLDLGQNAWPEEQAREIAKQAETRWREKAKK